MLKLLMDGKRRSFDCPSCHRTFTYWVREDVAHPKVKCYFCGKETFPLGEPPAAAPDPPAEKPAPAAG